MPFELLLGHKLLNYTVYKWNSEFLYHMYTSDDSSIIMMPRPGRHRGCSICILLFWMNKILILRRNCRSFWPSNYFKSMWFIPSDIWIAWIQKICMSFTLFNQMHVLYPPITSNPWGLFHPIWSDTLMHLDSKDRHVVYTF